MRYFRDALLVKANGEIRVTHFASMCDEAEMKDLTLEWLNQVNNVLLICLTYESIPKVAEIILAKRHADESGELNEKLFTVSFGERLPGWPPKGLHRGSSEKRDFSFGFHDPWRARPQDFESSPTMAALVSAIKGTN